MGSVTSPSKTNSDPRSLTVPSFTAHGRIEQQRVQVTWTDGEIVGDTPIARAVRERAIAMEGQYVGHPEGEGTFTNHLANPLSAVFLMRPLFDRQMCTGTGDVPYPKGPATR